MQNIQPLTPDILWVGGGDRRLALFENMFPLPNGVTYNSYVILDEKVAIVDTVDSSISRQFIENIEAALGGRQPDYLIVNHMEPDHCANIDTLCALYPGLKVVGNERTFQFIRQFYTMNLDGRILEVKELDELPLGRHKLRFYFAPMVHWPEVMFTYEETTHTLFSADAFGTFGGFTGNLCSSASDYENLYLDEARRYYTNIVGRFGAQVAAAIKKLDSEQIDYIAPLHGPVLQGGALALVADKYRQWASYTPEKRGVVLAYASMYGNTQNAVELFASRLAEKGVQDLRMFDVSKTNVSYIIADLFKYSHFVMGSPTYNMNIYHAMNSLLHDMQVLNLQNRTAAIIANGSWMPAAADLMKKEVSAMKNVTLLGEPLVLRSSLKNEQLPELYALADAMAASVLAAE